MPRRLAAGYVSNVWEANMLPINREGIHDSSSVYMTAKVPTTCGTRNVMNPKVMLFRRVRENSYRSISRPERNMMYTSPTWPKRVMALLR